MTSRRRDERGAVAILVALLVVTLCGIAAFSVDFGMAYKARMEQRTAADAGALAAARVYASTPTIGTCAETVAVPGLYAEANAAAADYARRNRDEVVPGDIVVTCSDAGLKVSLEVTGSTPAFFGKVIGSGETISQNNRAAALVDVPPAATGVRPLAVCSSNLPQGTPTGVFKVDGPGNGPAPAAVDTTDSDGGGTSDLAEQKLGTKWRANPASNSEDDAPDDDPDADGLSNRAEGLAGTDPLDSDTDDDGIPDGTDPEPVTQPSDCPDLADPGNWWTVQCPGNTGQKDLATAVRTGCDSAIEVVQGQGTLTGASLTDHLIENCAPDAEPSNCLEADPGQINGSPLLSAFDSLIANQTKFVLPVFCGQPSPCDPVAIRGAETGTGKAGSNTDYPVYRMIGVTICGYRFNNAVNHNGCDTWGGSSGDNYVLLQLHSVITSGVTSPSTCTLGDACDGGVRRVQLVE